MDTERLLLGFDPACRKLVSIEVVELAQKDILHEVKGERLDQLGRHLSEYRTITHPALVSVMEIGEDDGILFALRECVPGEILESYMRRIGKKLPVWSALDLALQMIDILAKSEPVGDCAKRIDPARSLLAPDFDGRLRLRVDGFVLDQRSFRAGSDRPPVQKVCDFLHYIFCGHWVPLRGGRATPMLGELPESVRYLVWAAFQKSAAQGAGSLDELKSALRRIQDNEESRPLAAAFQPVCRLRQQITGSAEIASLFGKKYRLDAASNPMIDEFLPTVHEQRLVQQPFGYSMRLHALPGGKMIGDSHYRHCLDQMDSPRNVSHRHVLRACDHEEKGDQFFVVEESINGFSLEELAVRRGGFEARDAVALCRHAHEALCEVEESGRWMWDLSAENVLVHFESRHSGAELLTSIDKPVAQWPSFKIVLRLHPTMSSLIRGAAVPNNPDSAEDGGDSLNEAAHRCRSLAALLWKLLSFNPYASQPMPYGHYRNLRRLTEEGNAMLECHVTGGDAAESPRLERAAFLTGIEENMDIFENPNTPAATAPLPRPVPVQGTSYVPGGSDSRRLHEDARDRARQLPDRPSLKDRLKKLSSAGLRKAGIRKLAMHLSMAALITGLAAVSFLFLNTGTRGQMVAFLGSVIDTVLRNTPAETAGTATEERSQSETRPAPAPAPEADELIPVVKSESAAASTLHTGTSASTCVPPEDAPEIREILTANAEDETAFLPNPEKALDALDEILGALRDNSGDITKDESALLRAARAGSKEALVMLGDLLIDSDSARAVAYYRRAADTGHPAAVNAMADCLWNGTGMPEDKEAAVEAYTRASELGSLQALETLGQLHLKGRIPAGSGSRSRLEILKAGAEKGSGRSAASLGVLYLNGLGVAKDPGLAAEYFERSALAGCVDGMLYYARCLQSGIGIPANKTASSHWFQKAANAGNEAALRWCRQHAVVVGSR